MNKRSYRRLTTDEKRMVLTEVQQPGVTLSEVCRKHNASPALVYRWRAVAQQATTQALQKVDSRGKSQPDAQTARLQADQCVVTMRCPCCNELAIDAAHKGCAGSHRTNIPPGNRRLPPFPPTRTRP